MGVGLASSSSSESSSESEQGEKKLLRAAADWSVVGDGRKEVVGVAEGLRVSVGFAFPPEGEMGVVAGDTGIVNLVVGSYVAGLREAEVWEDEREGGGE